MTTPAWVNITDTITSNGADMLDEGGTRVSPASFIRTLEKQPSDSPVNSMWWVIMIGADGFLKLQLQGLPPPCVHCKQQVHFQKVTLLVLTSGKRSTNCSFSSLET
jgi:hypothetical protein